MIDCHAHLWDPAAGFPWITPESPHHRAFRVEDLAGTPAVLVEASRGDLAENSWLRDLRERRPDLVLGYVGNLNVHAGTDPGRFREELAELRPNGMRLGGATWSAIPAGARALVPALAALGVPLDLNLHEGAVATAAALAARHPGLTVVVDHLGNPRDAATWQADVRQAAAIPGVVMKISGLLTQPLAELAPRAVEAFGPQRCVVGSDWPICLPRGSRSESLELAVRAFGGEVADAAAEVYGLLTRIEGP